MSLRLARDEKRSCRCTRAQIARHLRAISGSLLDRIDLLVAVPPSGLERHGALDERGGSLLDQATAD